MKNSVLLIVLGLILLTGCSKDDSIEQIEEQTTDSVYIFNQHNETSSWYTMMLDETQRAPILSNRVTVHTEGYFQPTSRNGMQITWIGTQNENKAKGSAELKQTSPNTNFHFILETECVTVNGNEAVYGGTITQIKTLSGGTPNISVGWHFYFKVIDSRVDQISNTTIFASPRSMSLCSKYPPNHPIWSSRGYEEVFSPGFVIVKFMMSY